ncbi:C39 family peptidase [Romboutsia lituseburensis]|uniref:C39 family peptidase n=1 Tax=Romboutsia lituseburensis TaxID=1537 RepID=UPI00215B4990|nr:C39 family peptidase [Romboutsia lituseburensis]MCR8746979.1 C39 family peptidase [Romboutsia lituseburensis]
MNFVKNKHRRNKDLRKNILFAFMILLLIFIVFFKTIFINAKNKETEVEVLALKNQELLQSTDPIIKDLVDKSKQNKKVNLILNNIDKYPEELLKLASKNSETVDFVADYSKYLSSTKSNSISVESDYKSGKIPLFSQWDERWGYEKYGDDYLAIDGCAPTSLAMVAVGLTGNTTINPKVVADYAYANNFYIKGVGSSWNLISQGVKYFGLKSEELPLTKSAIISTLKDKKPIILTVKPGTFTSTGHFLVLTGLTSDGKIKINDPNSKINSKKTWDVDVFLKETKNLWKISLLKT